MSLIMPGTGVREQLAMLDWFLRHHEGTARAVVLGIDEFWCGGDAALPPRHAFPFWLYERDFRAYVAGLLRLDAVERLGQRIIFLAGSGQRARPDGYWDYEPDFVARENASPERRQQLLQASPPAGDAMGRFPATTRLRNVLSNWPSQAALVLLIPPVFLNRAATGPERACAAAFARLAQAFPRTVWLDRGGNRPENRRSENFFDRSHYRAPMARALERDIAHALAQWQAHGGRPDGEPGIPSPK